ncbi:MAG: hypothetical protein HUU16_08985 [Candidatus Omnitrophica bacterium]|nr:hypothetical protein [bacterium]NUN96295.1 hypothetical protein [Candidatus Omnitrophota bacterium]
MKKRQAPTTERLTKDTLTLALEGEIPLQAFSEAVRNLSLMIESLTQEISSPDSVDWIIQDLSAGSATATIRGLPRTKAGKRTIGKVIAGYEEVATCLQEGRKIPFSESVSAPALAISGILNGKVKSVRFETSDFDAQVEKPVATTPSGLVEGGLPPKSFVKVHGAIRGRIQSISNRGSLRFTLYDMNDDHAIGCYLKPGSEDLLRASWGKVAVVHGVIRRDTRTGKAFSVREITSLKTQRERTPGAWRGIVGIAPAKISGASSETAVRIGRDAG